MFGDLYTVLEKSIPYILNIQSLAAPLILGGFTFLHPLLSQKGITGAKSAFKSSFFDILKVNWMVS